GPVEAVDADQEPGQRLARAGGGGDQRVAPGGDGDPPLLLGRRRALREPAGEPRRHRRVEGAITGRPGDARLTLEQRGLPGHGATPRDVDDGHGPSVPTGCDGHAPPTARACYGSTQVRRLRR